MRAAHSKLDFQGVGERTAACLTKRLSPCEAEATFVPVDFRSKLIQTLRALRPILEEDVLVIGSEVPNLLAEGQSVVIVSQDIDIGVPVSAHHRIRERLRELSEFRPSPNEPSVWLPNAGRGDLIEVNFVGMDPALDDISDSYVLEDDRLPLLVLGNLSLLEVGERILVEDVRVPVPEPTSLLVEKLLTERSGIKGDRDLLVALALLISPASYSEVKVRRAMAKLTKDERALVLGNLTTLSLMEGQPQMPDPSRFRRQVLQLIEIVEEGDE